MRTCGQRLALVKTAAGGQPTLGTSAPMFMRWTRRREDFCGRRTWKSFPAQRLRGARAGCGETLCSHFFDGRSGPEEMRTNCPAANGPDFDCGSSPILVDLGHGHRALVAGQKSGIVYALYPYRQGELLWQRCVYRGGSMGGVQWGSASDTKHVYVAVSDVTMHPVPSGTAGARDTAFGFAAQLDPKIGGGLFALKLETGEVAWQTPHPGCGQTPGCSPAQSAAVTAIPGGIFSGG